MLFIKSRLLRWVGLAPVLAVVTLVFVSAGASAASKASYWAFWDRSNSSNFKSIDHSELSFLLGTYVVTDHPSGINRFRYGAVSKGHKRRLEDYIATQQKIDPRNYSRDEQKVYWLNLYNALTINLVIDNYPVDSIKDISSTFGRGPWDKPLAKVAGQKLSLNDIEHRILRPIWKDFKIHFGLVCASLGCPNVQPAAFTVANSKKLLKQSGRDFVNHKRGLQLEKGHLQVSSLFDWYGSDFASDQKTLLKIFAHYSDDRKALYLLGFSGDISYNYDWRINSP
ncbi:MAG: DUF547 domain-containing protein [Porticoccaceae bacterium]|nr:DUF547 domain-containing protein [Porticoccaceae bacterium]